MIEVALCLIDASFHVVTDMLVAVLNTCSKEELDEHIPELQPDDVLRARRGVIKNKILAVGRMARVFAVLRCVGSSTGCIAKSHVTGYREESENVSELRNISTTGRLPYGTLALGAEGIKKAISSFEDAYVSLYFPLLHPEITYTRMSDGARISRTSGYPPWGRNLLLRSASPRHRPCCPRPHLYRPSCLFPWPLDQ